MGFLLLCRLLRQRFGSRTAVVCFPGSDSRGLPVAGSALHPSMARLQHLVQRKFKKVAAAPGSPCAHGGKLIESQAPSGFANCSELGNIEYLASWLFFLSFLFILGGVGGLSCQQVDQVAGMSGAKPVGATGQSTEQEDVGVCVFVCLCVVPVVPLKCSTKTWWPTQHVSENKCVEEDLCATTRTAQKAQEA